MIGRKRGRGFHGWFAEVRMIGEWGNVDGFGSIYRGSTRLGAEA